MAGEESMTEYEKQRLSRIRENEARLEALGLRGLAASLLPRNPSPSAAAKRKQKGRSADEDAEYVPSDEGGGEDDEEEERSSSESGQDDEVEGRSKSSSRSHAKGKKNKLLNSSNKSSKSITKNVSSFTSDFVDDDTALQQAIALSLAASCEKSVTTAEAESSSTGVEGNEGTPHKKHSKASIQDAAKNRKIKKMGKSKIQMTEDDVVAFFFSFDEVGKGYITPWDLERMATINDFIWTDSEISNMIRCFDSDGDGKINLEDFRSIVSRCNMLQEPEK
ncbi:hypothetical protein EJB05_38572 [Eragrostis curvula]|uniref:EF-hand domain-containing protein n=1 Tax=Eragrostis curvula TaxID=38414 RepID=A0A5J9SGT8_9POAL|nr:hypothetical protein EJB05_56686 [Eragrostis curvula]TVU15070.1 hypothetical protein EJB05_38572 [Eragrostis curvula]